MRCHVQQRRVIPTLGCCLLAIIFLGACSATPAASVPTVEPTEAPPEPTVTLAEPTRTPTPEPLPTLTPTAEPTEPAVSPATPQEVEFVAEDGQILHGTYYPSANESAPLVILMHWAPGDETDWVTMASWLQNRVDLSQVTAPYEAAWHDSSWFPPIVEGTSYAVFTFTFRGCEGGCKGFVREGWLLDAKAAVAAAQVLEGVDPERTVLVGASIGADGAVDACAQGCRGAFSLSPGDYLTLRYTSEVERLQSVTPVVPVVCLAADSDTPSADACRGAAGEAYELVIYPGGSHGMNLIAPTASPNVLDLLLDFLRGTLGD